jgi:DnaJ-domain-containing protein 1
MSLDHDSGRMDGEILNGTFKGRLLSAMPLEDLMAFRQDVAADADSRGLLEAYLDRAHVGWRADCEPDEEDKTESASPPPSGPMTRAEAFKVLALEPDADRKAIKAAYRSLMAKVHPDRGGSPYLAAKINEAKDLLLKD